MITKMRVVPKPVQHTRAILFQMFSGPAVKGWGDVSFSCGSCDTLLFESIIPAQIEDLVVKCAKCGSYNEAVPALSDKLDRSLQR